MDDEKYIRVYYCDLNSDLTPLQAIILGRIKGFERSELKYYESNKTLSEVIGVSESSVIRAINDLVEKGFIVKKTMYNKRILSIASPCQNDMLPCQNDMLPCQNDSSYPVKMTPYNINDNNIYNINDNSIDNIKDNNKAKQQTTPLDNKTAEEKAQIIKDMIAERQRQQEQEENEEYGLIY